MPQREALIRRWLDNILATRDYELALASGDASFRRYFRVTLPDRQSLIVMDAPPDKEDCRPFLDVISRLEPIGVHVPHVQAQDLVQGFLLLEDLGDRLYLGELTPATADSLYTSAIDALLRVQGGNTTGLPLYDRALLQREMRLFPDWLLQTHLDLRLDAREQSMLDEVFELLLSSALAQPRVLVHRDYHSRNLLLTGENSPGIIDFQDAVLGPVSYDLVSLLRDCYVAWPQERVDHWRDGYTRKAVEAGFLKPAEAADMPRWFDLMGAQRQLKAAGIFARLNHRDGKPGYLADIPRTLGYILQAAQRQPELVPLAALIQERVLPALEAA